MDAITDFDGTKKEVDGDVLITALVDRWGHLGHEQNVKTKFRICTSPYPWEKLSELEFLKNKFHLSFSENPDVSRLILLAGKYNLASEFGNVRKIFAVDRILLGKDMNGNNVDLENLSGEEIYQLVKWQI